MPGTSTGHHNDYQAVVKQKRSCITSSNGIRINDTNALNTTPSSYSIPDDGAYEYQTSTEEEEAGETRPLLESSTSGCDTICDQDDDEDDDDDDDAVEPPPDGGYGWAIVCVGFLLQFISVGISESWGVMQEYHEHHEFPNALIQVSFVGTISNVLLNGLGPVARLLSAVTSLRNIMFMAVVLCFLGLEAASYSTEIWHFYLTRGVLFGAGASFAFYVALSIVPQWFSKRRGLALGISSTGTCIGAFSLPFVMTTINSHLGGAWSYRVQGFIVLVLGLISCVLVRERKKPLKKGNSKRESVQLKDIFQFEILKDPSFVLWCIADILMEAAYYVPYFYLPSHATYLGLSPAQGSVLISVVSGMSFVGNLVSGITADWIGHINTMMLYSILCALSCVIWVAADSFKTLVAFCILAGFFGGAFIALTPSVTYVITGAKKFESGLSLFLLITVVSMFGPNVSSAFEQSLHARPYLSYEIFTALGYLSGAAVLALIKIVKTDSLLSKI